MTTKLSSLILGSSAIFIALLSGCSTTDKSADNEPAQEPTRVESFYSLEDFSVARTIAPQDWTKALKAFRLSCRSLSRKADWSDVCRKAAVTGDTSAESFFTENFNPWKISKVEIGTQTGTVYNRSDEGLMTGYYEPRLFTSSVQTPEYSVPILGTPNDLIIVDLAQLYPQLKGLRLRGKLVGRKLVPYDSRSEIVKRHDLNQYAIAWSNDPIAVFFLQIQGSGRLEGQDGSVIRVGYDDQNGHPYKAVGSWLVQKGYLKKHEVSMQNIQKWARENPERVNELLNLNPSFVFFKTRTVTDPSEGPLGAQGLPLTAQASVAVDRKQIALGTPLIVSAEQDNPDLKFTKPVIAQDTGGAIRGPLRFDFFWGYGDEAGQQAGRQKSRVNAWVLLPKHMIPTDPK